MKLKNIKLIGVGAFASVYLVQDLITGKYYAKKVVKFSDLRKKIIDCRLLTKNMD